MNDQKSASANNSNEMFTGILQWLGGRDTGLSSKSLALTILGAPPQHIDYPLDPDDLGRCLRLIERVPEVRTHLDRMSPLDPVWAQYVEHWSELETLYRAEVPDHQGSALQTYDLMHQLQNKALLRYVVEAAVEGDIPPIKRIASRNSKELGFVRTASLSEAVTRRELTVVLRSYPSWMSTPSRGSVMGFVNWHTRRDGWTTIYEIAVGAEYRRAGIGKAMLAAVPSPTRLKCTQDNDGANAFYAANGFVLARTEMGKKRPLNVWERQG